MKKRLTTQDSVRQIAFTNAFETERVCNLLSQNGIDYIGQLCLQTKKDLRAIDKIGDVTIKIIENALHESGLRLGMSLDEVFNFEDKTQNYPPEFTSMDDLMRFVASRNGFNSLKPVHIIGHDIEADDLGEDDDETATIKLELNIHHTQEEEASEPNWDDRFYEIAKEEFFRQCRLTTCEETRAERAVIAAKIFIEAVKIAINENNQPKQ